MTGSILACRTTKCSIIWSDIIVEGHHINQIQETEANQRQQPTKQEPRNRIIRIINWLDDNYPTYIESGGVVEITGEQIADPKCFQHDTTRDLVYSGRNTRIIKAFLAAHKMKANGKIVSFSQLRKFNGVILFGAEQTHQILLQIFHQAITMIFDNL